MFINLQDYNSKENKTQELLNKILAQLISLKKNNINKKNNNSPTQISSFNDIKCLTFNNSYYLYPKKIYLPYLQHDYNMPKLALNMFPRFYYNKHGPHLYYRQFNQMYFQASNTTYNYYYHHHYYHYHQRKFY